MKPYEEVSPSELWKRIEAKENVKVVDVREPEEWESGHITGAVHIPLGEIPDRLNELDPKEEIVMVCRSGNRSGRACDFLSSRGYQVVNMTGGMLNWFWDTERP